MFQERLPQVWSKQDWQTEYEAASFWDRPARTNLNDTPFYPWMPRQAPQYKVTFKLGFKP
uniref:Uncharacterized protein n=1 Tax=Alphatorquevirus sp. TaxID=2809145 RepID=A0A8K1XIP2_9VIRU|nr:MAG: hypothetical protein [Alphatorquevirus sp.]